MFYRRRFSKQNFAPKEDIILNAYTIELNDNWRLSTTVLNPDPSLYDGVYESYSNHKTPNSCATVTITIRDLDKFTLYIRSYAESYYDYVMVSQLDKVIDQNTSYLYTELVKAHTRGTQLSGTDIYSYTPVTFENIGGGEHVITIIYRKDSSGDSYDDTGYLLIGKPKASTDAPDSGDTPDNEQMDVNNYLTIEALEDGLTAYLSASNCEYCIDGDNNWVTLTAGSTSPSINQGQTISFKGNIQPSSSTGIGTFTISKSCNLKGNCMSMLFGDNANKNYSLSGYNYAFYKLFQNCHTIQNVSKNFLPAMVLSSNCYYYMFYNCSNLLTAPDLPATTLAGSCYYSMFYNCSNLLTAPNLPGQTLQSYCYYCMFYNCKSLTQAPIISATTLAYHCCYYMFYNCTNLVIGPGLLALKLESYCYYSMFSGCISLTYLKMLATDISASGCLSSWVKNINTDNGVFIKNINATWDVTGDNGIPPKWSIQYYNPDTGQITT